MADNKSREGKLIGGKRYCGKTTELIRERSEISFNSCPQCGGNELEHMKMTTLEGAVYACKTTCLNCGWCKSENR